MGQLGEHEGKTYRLVRDEHEHLIGFTCLVCGMTSSHPMDIKHRYCGKCGVFHDDPGVELVWDAKKRMAARKAGA